MKISELRDIALRIRRRILRMAAVDKSVHAGASLSVTDILVALYFGIGVRLEGPKPTHRDWVILSKGHAVPALYAILTELGLLEEAELDKIRTIDGLEGHPDFTTPGVDVSTGSLGQGLSIGAGIAYAMRLDGTEGKYNVFVILGDGELDEGQVWEAATTAAHLRLRSLVAIVDVNGFQLDGPTDKIKSKGSIAARWSSIGWHVVEADGHSFKSLLSALEEAIAYPGPAVVLAYTRRGRGLGILEKTGGQHVNPEYAKQFIE
ncbi:1-deoxy-D-xylulose-5-phosphate synthase N-terminal domain-containing protein [Pyrolobus fumarii]|nr:1-deoxy-D-xylulose-5-phosphate synthase N-terminal domain-containing protein [Pyrolobus fumarii]